MLLRRSGPPTGSAALPDAISKTAEISQLTATLVDNVRRRRPLTEADVVGEAELAGPEDVTPGLDGHLYTGTADGAVWRLVLDPAGRIERFEQIAAVAGRVPGLDAYSETTLVAAVAEVGLIAIDTTTAETWVLADRLDGNLIFFADAVAVADDGTIYVTEACTVYLPGFPNDFLDGRPNGRLLRYEPSTGAIDVVADGLPFANGIDVAADESYALVAESFRFRILRVWLHGDRAGTTEPFGPPLVNGPDNLRLDDRGRVWIGGSDLRSDATDAALTNPDVRRSIALTDEERAPSARRTASPRSSTPTASRSSASTTPPAATSRSAPSCSTTT